ncbi:hypothetical protein PAMA_019849 [Pampus argenteus]
MSTAEHVRLSARSLQKQEAAAHITTRNYYHAAKECEDLPDRGSSQSHSCCSSSYETYETSMSTRRLNMINPSVRLYITKLFSLMKNRQKKKILVEQEKQVLMKALMFVHRGFKVQPVTHQHGAQDLKHQSFTATSAVKWNCSSYLTEEAVDLGAVSVQREVEMGHIKHFTYFFIKEAELKAKNEVCYSQRVENKEMQNSRHKRAQLLRFLASSSRWQSGRMAHRRLDANFISRLPAASFRGLSSLRHLWLDDNVLTEVPVVALSNLSQLQALTLALNNIRHVPDRAFAFLHQLVVLHLHDNRIRSLGSRCFDGLNNLEILFLSGSITELPDFTGTNRLETLVTDQLFGLQSCVFLHCFTLTSPQDSGGLSMCCVDLLRLSVFLLFILSVIFNLLVLVSSSSTSSSVLLVLLFWFRLLAGVSGTCVLVVDCLCGLDLQADAGRGLVSVLLVLSSESCVFLVMSVLFEDLRCFQVTCAVCCSLAVAVTASPALLLLFNTSCFLFATVVHLSRRCREEDVTLNLMLTFLLLTNTVLSLCASLLRLPGLLSPGVSSPAALLFIAALPSCLDPLLFIIFRASVFPKQQVRGK